MFCDGKAGISDARAMSRAARPGLARQRQSKAKIAWQGRSKARIGNGVVTRALLRQARAEMGIDRHGKGNVKLSNA